MNVKFNLYDSTGLNLEYTFPIVFQANYPHTEKHLIEHENVRGQGSIIIDGGNSAWDITLKGVLIADDYQALIALIDDMESKVILNTPYVLKINKTASTYYEYKVKRITPIIFDETSLRTKYVEYEVTFRVDTW